MSLDLGFFGDSLLTSPLTFRNMSRSWPLPSCPCMSRTPLLADMLVATPCSCNNTELAPCFSPTSGPNFRDTASARFSFSEMIYLKRPGHSVANGTFSNSVSTYLHPREDHVGQIPVSMSAAASFQAKAGPKHALATISFKRFFGP